MQKTKVFRKFMGAALCAGMLVGLAGSMPVTVQAATKTVNISAICGKTKTIADLKTVPTVSSGTKVSFSKTSKGVKFKSKQEGLVKFKAGGKNYRVLVIPDNLPKNNFKLGSLKCKNGIYYTERKDNLDSWVTVYNSNDYDVDVTYTHSDYKDKTTLFESRKYTEKALTPGESYTFFVYSCMPYSKNSVSVTKSKYQSVSENDVYTAVDSFNQQQTLFNYANNTNQKITVKISYANLDENGKINSCGETEEIVLPANSRPSYAILNYGFCPSDVKIIDFHAYITK
ncbi:MAG: hypothetical protein SPL82_03905 [Lachnospiraceae bacterium]|nr:hypothetical protein [Lachnospiraceae bacterium]